MKHPVFIFMDVPRHLLFVPHSHELKHVPLFESCVCFPPSLLHEKQKVNERIFFEKPQQQKKKGLPVPCSFKQEQNPKDKGFI
jgi:hypothetical protein